MEIAFFVLFWPAGTNSALFSRPAGSWVAEMVQFNQHWQKLGKMEAEYGVSLPRQAEPHPQVAFATHGCSEVVESDQDAPSRRWL